MPLKASSGDFYGYALTFTRPVKSLLTTCSSDIWKFFYLEKDYWGYPSFRISYESLLSYKYNSKDYA